MKNNDITLNERDLKLKKLLFSIILYIAYPAYILHSLVVSPLYTITDSNIAFNGIIPLSLYFVYNIIDIFVIFLSLAVVIYGLCRLGGKAMRSVIALVMLAPIFKYVLKIIISPFIDGFVDFDQLLMDVYNLGISGCLEILQLLIILLLANISIKKYRDRSIAMKKAYARLGKEYADRDTLLPFEKLFSTKNPLQNGALISAIFVFVVRLAMHLINDLWGTVNIVFNMLFFLPYILSFISGILGYFLMFYVFISIGMRDE